MWKEYANNEEGICIFFDKNQINTLPDFLNSQIPDYLRNSYFKSGKVFYKDTLEYTKELDDICNRIIQCAKKTNFKSNKRSDEVIKLAQYVLEISIFSKLSDYKKEKEYRLIFITTFGQYKEMVGQNLTCISVEPNLKQKQLYVYLKFIEDHFGILDVMDYDKFKHKKCF